MEHAAVPSMNRETKLSEWIEMYSDTILRTCYLYLSDLQQAEDVLQDTWIKAWKHMDDLERKEVRNEKAWLLRIAINTCKDYRRTAWFRHIDRKNALEELPARFTMIEPDDRSMSWILPGAYPAGNSGQSGLVPDNRQPAAAKSRSPSERRIGKG